MMPPKPAGAEGRSSLPALIRGFRRDLLSTMPQRLFRAWMAEYRGPLIHSFVCNDPALVELVLKTRASDFPKSRRLREGLAPLLGNGVFIANGEDWARQRRIIDPAFEGGRLRQAFPAMWEAGTAAAARLSAAAGQEVDLEPETSHAAADVIFRTLFSLPIEHGIAAQVFAAFRAHQDAQPLVNLAAILPLPRWMPRPHSRRTRATAGRIRGLIETLVDDRIAAIESLDGAEAGQVIDATGDLVSAPFVDPHFHLDATLSYGLPRINASSKLLERIALWGELKEVATVDEMVARALEYYDRAASLGLLAIRSHVDT